VQVMNCTTDLNDVTRVINGAQVSVAPQYTRVALDAQQVVPALAVAQSSGQAAAFQIILGILEGMRHSLATISPDLPG
jgi:hypothetical protein